MDAKTKWRKRIDEWSSEYDRTCSTNHKRITEYYANKYPKELLSVNLIFSFGRGMVPQLYFKNPVVAIDIERPGYEEAANTLQRMDARLIQAMQIKNNMKKLITSAYCYGRGVGKLGWNAETMDAALVTQMMGSIPSTNVPIWKLRDQIRPNAPWFLPFYQDDFAFDARVSDLEDSAWQAMRFERSKEQLARDKGFDWLDKDIRDDDGDPDSLVTFWEIWDKYTGKFVTLCDEQDELSPETDISVWPFFTLDFNWIPRQPFPMSDAELILCLQDEYNEIKTQIHEHRRVSLVKILARKNALDREAKQKLESGKVGPIVEIDGVPNETVSEFKPTIPMELFTTSNTTMDDIRDVIGFTRNQLGEFQSPRRTAREAQIVQQAIMLRLDERRDMVGDLVADIMVGANDYCLGRWEAQEVEKYAGRSDGWEQLAEIQDEYVISVVADSTLPTGRQVQQAEAKEMYMTLRGDPLIDQLKLRTRYLKAFETGDVDLINQQAAMQLGGMPGAVPGATPGMATATGATEPAGQAGPTAPQPPMSNLG